MAKSCPAGAGLGGVEPSPRRRWLRQMSAAAAAVAAGPLAGCGFALRQPPELPWRRISLRGFAPRSAMAEALRQALPASVTLVDPPTPAELVVLALDDRLLRTVVASTATGLVRELRLRVVLKLRLQGPDGGLLLPDTELEQSRDMSYTESAALAKEAEEAHLVQEMRADIAAQLLRLLAAAGRTRKLAPAVAPAAASASAPAPVPTSAPASAGS